MAKKKQFSGKKTKLAKLALTAVLAQQDRETPPLATPPPAPAPPRPPAFPWSEPPSEPADALYRLYTHTIQALEDLYRQFWPSDGCRPGIGPSFPSPPPATWLKKALHLVRQEIMSISRLLSPAG